MWEKSVLKHRPVFLINSCKFLFIILLGIATLFLHFYRNDSNFQKMKMKANFERTVQDLRNLQEIAKEHGESRSVVKGHLASVEYVKSELAKFNDTWTVYTQNVPVNVQVDEIEPKMNVWFLNRNRSFLPRLELATARGSGSIHLQQAKAHFVESCSIETHEENWIAIIDTSRRGSHDCNVCDRMIDAIREGAKGLIFLSSPGTLEGYPHGLPPGRGPCGRIPKYQNEMKMVGAVTLGDHAAFEFLSMMASNPKNLIDFQVISAFREFQTLNVLADSTMGDPENIVLFGSHLDGVPQGPGINDDGTGAMATLELARAFSESGIIPKQKLRLAFWAAEEIGLVGSRYYVDQLAINDPEELKRIKLSMDNDMLASPNYIRGVYDGSTVIEPVLRRGCIAIQKLFQKFFGKQGLATAPGVFDGRSDYVGFMNHGIPSGGLFTGADALKTREQAELFGGLIGVPLDPCYHQECDRVEYLYGPGFGIYKQNIDALSFALESYAVGNLTKLLDPDNYDF